MQELFGKLHEVLEKGEAAVLVTVVAGSGSTPRGSGARMLVTKAGRIAGTIGGGAVEYEAEKLAKKCLESKGSTSEHFILRHNDVADIGMICGGNVEVFFRYIAEGDKYMLSLAEAVDKMFEEGEKCYLVTEIIRSAEGQSTGDGPSRSQSLISLYSPKSGLIGSEVPGEVLDATANKPVQVEAADGRCFFIEKLVEAGRVFIFGGGHVSQQLVPMLARCNFRCVVIEDREAFAKPELFEGKASQIRLADMDNIAELVPEITEDDYICIMTRGHKDDYLVQYQMLKTPACYIGVIGSRHKIAGVNAKLSADGYGPEDIARITTPIGLDILAETPAEIAVSVTAQLIGLRAKRNESRKYLERIKEG